MATAFLLTFLIGLTFGRCSQLVGWVCGGLAILGVSLSALLFPIVPLSEIAFALATAISGYDLGLFGGILLRFRIDAPAY